jgi:hypothetical protein
MEETIKTLRDTLSELNSSDNTTCAGLKANIAQALNKLTSTLSDAGYAPDGSSPDLSVCDCE